MYSITKYYDNATELKKFKFLFINIVLKTSENIYFYAYNNLKETITSEEG